MASSLFGPQIPTQQQSAVQPQSNNLFGDPQQLEKIRTLWSLFNSGGNSAQMVQSMLMSNPQMKTLMDFAAKFNGNFPAAFTSLAKQKNVDPNQFIGQLRQAIGL